MHPSLRKGHTPIIAKFFLEDFDWGHIEIDKVEKVKTIPKVIEKQTLDNEKDRIYKKSGKWSY